MDYNISNKGGLYMKNEIIISMINQKLSSFLCICFRLERGYGMNDVTIKDEIVIENLIYEVRENS